MSDDEAVSGAGGYCAPSMMLYDVIGADVSRVHLPVISAARGGVDFTDRRTDAEKAAADAMQARISRMVASVLTRQRDAVNAACVVALAEGWDVHVYRRDDHGISHRDLTTVQVHIGIGFEEAQHAIPTIHEHQDHDETDWWDD